MRDYNCEIQYSKRKCATLWRRTLKAIANQPTSPATTALGFPPKFFFKELQREEVKLRELIEYLEGGSVPTKGYHKTIL